MIDSTLILSVEPRISLLIQRLVVKLESAGQEHRERLFRFVCSDSLGIRLCMPVVLKSSCSLSVCCTACFTLLLQKELFFGGALVLKRNELLRSHTLTKLYRNRHMRGRNRTKCRNLSFWVLIAWPGFCCRCEKPCGSGSVLLGVNVGDDLQSAGACLIPR
jgi:hypothetical protein